MGTDHRGRPRRTSDRAIAPSRIRTSSRRTRLEDRAQGPSQHSPSTSSRLSLLQMLSSLPLSESRTPINEESSRGEHLRRTPTASSSNCRGPCPSRQLQIPEQKSPVSLHPLAVFWPSVWTFHPVRMTETSRIRRSALRRRPKLLPAKRQEPRSVEGRSWESPTSRCRPGGKVEGCVSHFRFRRD
jgi:hypothetical protein